MSAKATLCKIYERINGPIGFIGSLAGIAMLCVWTMSQLDIEIPEVDLEPEAAVIIVLLALLYLQSGLLLNFARRNRILKLKLDTKSGQPDTKGEAHPHQVQPTKQEHKDPTPRPTNQPSNRSPREGRRCILTRTFLLRRDEIWEHRIRAKAGCTLTVRVTSSGPVNAFILDDWHYSRNDFGSPEEEEADVLDATFVIRLRKTVYYIIIMNQEQRNANVNVDAWVS